MSFVSPFIQANAIRGVLAAVGCAVLFALLAVVYKFRWRANGDKVSFQIFSKIKSYDMKISQNFLKTPGAQIRPGERKSHLQQGGGRRERDRQPSDGQQIKLSFGILFFSMPQQEHQEMISLIYVVSYVSYLIQGDHGGFVQTLYRVGLVVWQWVGLT